LPKAAAPWDEALGMPLHEAFRLVHTQEGFAKAFARLQREEWHVHQHLLAEKRAEAQVAAPVITPAGKTKALLQALPWALTPAQEAAWRAIQADLQSGRRMHRLVQGDVGSGKTVVAALACCAAVENGWQAALMSPTEVLARQHHAALSAWLAPLGIEVHLLVGGLRTGERKAALEALRQGRPCVVVGTHALISDAVRFARLGLAVVDEQHRFGVRQRWMLAEKGEGVHLLSMTATPIPRSLALALYGDLDLTVMQGMPPGRKPVITRVIRNRAPLRDALRRMLDQGGRIYWIVPRVDAEDEDANVSARARQLARHFPDAGVRALHGRMRADEKAEALSAFADGRCRLLVSTTVVEVGVNVPEARVIVIEQAERYGLAQLHQLRGRVGRSDAQGYCILLPSPQAGEAQLERLRLLERCHDGLALAEEDLKRRGAGDPVGLRQSGEAGFRLLDPIYDAAEIRRWSEDPPPEPPTEAMIRFWKPEADQGAKIGA
ncbi:MAG: DEAD/DEAH box helicase, partial [Zetaproteobacteria bacterium]